MSTVDASEASILPSLLTSPSFMVITDADGVSSGVVAVSLLLDAVAAAPVSSAVTAPHIPLFLADSESIIDCISAFM